MNAKARRKLLRQQQQLKEQQQVKEEPQEAAVKTEAVEEKQQEDKPLNAKQRRLLARQAAKNAEKEADGKDAAVKAETAAEVAAEAGGEKLNAKQRRLLARQAARGDDDGDDDGDGKKTTTTTTSETGDKSAVTGKKRKRSGKKGEEEEEQGKPRKSIHLTLFVGQLPFKATEAQVRKHFAEAGDITLRMLTDKKTKRFKGTAFIEVKDSKALGAALSRHHTLLNGRRINVELTASGGGNKSEQRRTKIDLLRKKQSNVQVEKARALLQKRADAPESKVTPEDIDDRVVDFLSWFDYETAKSALDEFDRCVSDRVMNRKAFFMGILKRFVQTDGAE